MFASPILSTLPFYALSWSFLICFMPCTSQFNLANSFSGSGFSFYPFYDLTSVSAFMNILWQILVFTTPLSSAYFICKLDSPLLARLYSSILLPLFELRSHFPPFVQLNISLLAHGCALVCSSFV